MIVRQQIEEKILQSLQPEIIVVRDNSHQHVGHVGANEKGETHFHLLVVCNVFEGLSRVKRHKEIYIILDDLLKNHIHALSLELYTPYEYSAQKKHMS